MQRFQVVSLHKLSNIHINMNSTSVFWCFWPHQEQKVYKRLIHNYKTKDILVAELPWHEVIVEDQDTK